MAPGPRLCVRKNKAASATMVQPSCI
ncbi:hypothetical protein CCACVL1_27595 [Corchorus capsularis]|uniref:Uncharacterized protein n=1 Tax=Corchorus capsularis TaxID=210143 RepID=A0A1R3G9T1_COCAP|nr:hypothetical protein CCACVL1_27595 [Corchorus capsularis]